MERLYTANLHYKQKFHIINISVFDRCGIANEQCHRHSYYDNDILNTSSNE